MIRKKMGRPPIHPSKRKSVTLSIRIDEESRSLIEEYARRSQNMPFAQAARVLLGQKLSDLRRRYRSDPATESDGR